jgi:hypothetical protein
VFRKYVPIIANAYPLSNEFMDIRRQYEDGKLEEIINDSKRDEVIGEFRSKFWTNSQYWH